MPDSHPRGLARQANKKYFHQIIFRVAHATRYFMPVLCTLNKVFFTQTLKTGLHTLVLRGYVNSDSFQTKNCLP